MSAKIVKSTRVTALILGVSLCILGCLSIFTLAEKSENSASQAPLRSILVTIEASQREELFEQLHKFADEHAFSYNLTDYGGQGEYFLVEIRGDNIKILANETSRDLTMYDISFFAPSPGDPLPKKAFVDDLVVDLKTFLSKIPNVTITEEK